MHPNPAFEWTDRGEMLDLVARESFAHIFVCGGGKMAVAHAPVLVTGDGNVRFHIARRNRAADLLPGNPLLVSVVGQHAYQSASWYVSENQVPTWHYEAVEIEGEARELGSDELVQLLDELSDVMERRHSPDRVWSRTKMKPGSFEAMLNAIAGFEIVPDEIRGTRKFNQHKSAQDRASSAEGLRRAGFADVAARVEQANRDG